MSVNLTRNSRLNFGTLLLSDGVEFWDLINYPKIPEMTDDALYQVKAGDRLDVLAYKFYGYSEHWWILAIANDIELLPTDLYVGQTIRVPSATYVRSLFGSQ